MNKRNILPLVGAASLCALSAGLTSVLVVRNMERAAPDTPHEQPLHLPGTDHAELLVELRALREAHEQLSSRLGALEGIRGASQREALGPSISLAEFNALKQRVEDLRGEPSASTDQPSALKSHVADALSAVRQEEAHQAELQRLAKQDARLEQRVPR